MQRWTPTWTYEDIGDDDRGGEPRAIMEAVEDGNWVKHSDAAAQLAAKDAEIERLEGDLLTFNNIGYELRVRAEKAERERDDALEALRVRLSESIDSSKTPDATRRLALAVAEVAKWREGHNAGSDDHGPFIVYADDVTPCEEEMCEYMKQLDAARAATDADPVLRAMIEKGMVT